ncbi:MAG: HAD-IC family P-type ATPase, partial [Candidatus Diapherotrites archaeon]|nr:HAD-IC family P-type ATPase [Candidatus Diapherotrites archaeon]
MTVREIYDNSRTIKITGVGWAPKGEFMHKPPKELMLCATLCNNAHLQNENGTWAIIGDPTEAALISMAAKAGFKKYELEEKFPEINEIPFSSERKMMSTLHQKGRKFAMYSKGAPEIILDKCDKVMVNGTVIKLTAVKKKEIIEQNKKMAANGLRVLGFAYKDVLDKPKEFDAKMENKLIFGGLAGMIDPPRPEVKQAIALCRSAGIQVKMITGDHELTAKAVAKELGLFQNKDKIITGKELNNISDYELEKIVEATSVFARVNPDHKVRIVEALQRKGHSVAMTGDGVNDAPALKIADIGVAMGIKGTDVSKESADIILRDDNFSTIVLAVKEGRAIYDNIRKFVRFLLSANFDEIAVIGIATIAGWPLPFLPVQILWINLATDGLPALALGNDPANADIMHKKPRPKKETILHNMGPIIIVTSALATIAALLIFNTELMLGNGLERARTMVLTTAIMFELFRVFSCRIDEQKNIWPKLSDFTANRMLLVAVAISFFMHLFVIYFPPLQVAFSTVALGMTDWIIVILMASTAFLVHPLVYQAQKISQKP